MSPLEAEWAACPKNWYSLYQWKPTSRKTYLEWIAGRIADEFASISLNTTRLRTASFREPSHRGQIQLTTNVSHINEKRLVRALCTLHDIPNVGKAIDYEVPLQDSRDAQHGDIDLLCRNPDACVCLETKQPNSSESILKALLQAYSYTMLVATQRQRFLGDFSLPLNLHLTPGVLTFASATSGRCLRELNRLPNTLRLIRILNGSLSEHNIQPLRFFVVENPDSDFTNCLVTSEDLDGDVRVAFRPGLSLSISEHKVP